MATRTRLAAAKFRLALLAEGRQALTRVLGGEGEVERLSLVVEPRFQRRLEGTVHRLLRKPLRDRRLLPNRTSDPLRFAEPGLFCDHTRHLACALTLHGPEHPTREADVHP